MRPVTLALTVSLAAATAFADPLMGYSGRLYNSTGTPMSGSHDVVVRIFSTPLGGTSLFEESFDATDVADGYFMVMMGVNEKMGGMSLDTLFATESDGLYLELQVGAETLSPRQPLGSVPWAFGGGSLASLSCSAGQVAQWDGTKWVCATVSAGGGGGGGDLPTCSPGQILEYTGVVWGCGNHDPGGGGGGGTLDFQATAPIVADDSVEGTVALSLTPCGANQILQTNAGGTAWACVAMPAGGSATTNASDLTNGTLSTSRYSAFSDLVAEGRASNSNSGTFIGSLTVPAGGDLVVTSGNKASSNVDFTGAGYVRIPLVFKSSSSGTVNCDTGDVATGGGCVTGDGEPLTKSAPTITVGSPSGRNYPTGWVCTETGSATPTAYAICLDADYGGTYP